MRKRSKTNRLEPALTLSEDSVRAATTAPPSNGSPGFCQSHWGAHARFGDVKARGIIIGRSALGKRSVQKNRSIRISGYRSRFWGLDSVSRVAEVGPSTPAIVRLRPASGDCRERSTDFSHPMFGAPGLGSFGAGAWSRSGATGCTPSVRRK
jgi:hypothetical protein